MENQKEQQGVCYMKNEIHQVVPPRTHSEELNIQHVGEPRQGMPVTGMTRREGPFKTFHGQTGLYLRVLGDIHIIIIVDELMILHLPVDGCGNYYQGKADE
jgi:hypothetical protein